MLRTQFLPDISQMFLELAMEHPERFKVDVNLFRLYVKVYDGSERVFAYEEDDEHDHICAAFIHDGHRYYKFFGPNDDVPQAIRIDRQTGKYESIESDDFRNAMYDFYYDYSDACKQA